MKPLKNAQFRETRYKSFGRFFRRSIFVLLLLYCLYLIKSGLGIDISHSYHLGDIFLRPAELIRAVTHRVLGNQA